MKTSRFWTTYPLILFLATLCLGVLWLFLLLKSFSYKSEILAVHSEIAEAENRATRLFSVRNIWRGAESDLQSIENRFVREDEVSSFIAILEKQAEDLGVKIELSNITIDPAVKNIPFRSLRAHINSSGSWRDLISFVHNLDTMAYAMRINKVSFSRSYDTANPNTSVSLWNVSMEISQYIK